MDILLSFVIEIEQEEGRVLVFDVEKLDTSDEIVLQMRQTLKKL